MDHYFMQFKVLIKCCNFSVKTLKKMWAAAISMIYSVFLYSSSVYAESVSDSKIAKGTQKLIQDVTTWLMVLAPVVAGLLIIYFFIRRSAADEMDQKKWNNRIVVAIVSCIGAILGSAILNLIIGYYQ